MADLGQTDFGQTDFGQRECFSGMADFGQTKTDFGQNRLWPNRLWPNRVVCALCAMFVCNVCVCVFVCVCLCVWRGLVSRFHGVGFHVWVLVWSCSVPRGPPFSRTAQNVALFSPLPPQISFFLLSLGGRGSSRGIVAAVQPQGPHPFGTPPLRGPHPSNPTPHPRQLNTHKKTKTINFKKPKQSTHQNQNLYIQLKP